MGSSLFLSSSSFLWSFSLFLLCLGTTIACFDICVVTNQPTDQPRYRVQVGSLPNNKNEVNMEGKRHILMPYHILLVIITHTPPMHSYLCSWQKYLCAIPNLLRLVHRFLWSIHNFLDEVQGILCHVHRFLCIMSENFSHYC